jgi:hypothetical protein
VITDSQGRMAGADRIVFTRQGDAFQNGALAQAISVNAEGTRATALVPQGLDAMAYNLTVHRDPATPVFGALAFLIAADDSPGLCP